MLKILKTGKFAHPNPSKPQTSVTAGETRSDIDAVLTARLIETGYAEEAVADDLDTEEPVKKKRGRKKKQ